MKYAWYILFSFLAVLQSISSVTTKKYNTLEYAQMHGYPTENHFVTTEDGYILNVHRIPTGKQGQTNGKIVFLQHGLIVDSFSWVLLGPGKALAYILADEGYDVWMGNTRGNEYSRNHTTLDPDSEEFWDFSFHEFGVYDLPATIDYILEKTGTVGVYYSGHSQGTTSLYVMGSERPDYNKKITVYVHLSPVAYMSHLTSLGFKIPASIEALTPGILQRILDPELLSSDGLLSLLAPVLCENLLASAFCGNILYLIFGFSPDKVKTSTLEQIAEQYPSGASTMQFIHYLQLYNSGKFCQYDRGLRDNLRRYGQATPPSYNLKAVTAPGYLIYAKNDWVSDYETDVPRLRDELGNCLGAFLDVSSSFNHLDFLFSESAPDVYQQTVDLFSQY